MISRKRKKLNVNIYENCKNLSDEDEDKKGKYDKRNKLNDLTGKEWLKLTKSYMFSEKCAEDKEAFNHPAPFLIKDIEKLISMFTKSGMTVLDPFAGSGTTLIASSNLERKNISIDLNPNYRVLAESRLHNQGKEFNSELTYLVGDSNKLIKSIDNVDYIVTSPPYHNILRNKGAGLRKKNDNYRTGSRLGIEYYSEDILDLGNQDDYNEFIRMLRSIMDKCYNKLNYKKYCSIIMSDFTVNKIEKNVQGDIITMMNDIGYEFVGTIVLLQDNKPLYPFGYPYAFKINHVHQNIMNFRKFNRNE